SKEKAFTRAHALAESFSALTGNPEIRLDADMAARTLEQLLPELEFVDLSAAEIIAALKKARRKGVRGGHVHDLLHAAAADKSGAEELLTLDANDFAGLADKSRVVAI